MPTRTPTLLRRARPHRLADRSLLLVPAVLAVALTVAPGAPLVAQGTRTMAATGRATAVTAPIVSLVAERARADVAGRTAAANHGQELARTTGCAPDATIDIDARRRPAAGATAPESRAKPGCLLAGPKRVHGSAVELPTVPTVKPVMAAPARPRWNGGVNLFRTSAFVTQRDFTWCVAASVQMMVNIVRHHHDRTAATQKRMITYAQASDHGPWGPGGGTDVTGWIAALRHFGAGRYRAVGASTPGAALRIAATAMRQTGRPAGMLVMEGRHAWVLHGFESRTDPRRDRHAKITSVRVSGPLYPVQQKHGYDMRPNTELSVRALARYFKPSSVGALVGKYVVVVPVH